MPKTSMKGALGASLNAETLAFQERLAKADALTGALSGGEKRVDMGGNAASGPAEVMASQVAASEVAAPMEPQKESKPVARVVREAFTIPEAEHAQIETIRTAMLSQAVAVSKSEVVRAGLQLLCEADESTRRAIFERLERVKTGRPKTG